MKNIDVVNAFINGKVAKTGNLKTDGCKLINYSTVIALKDAGKIVVSSTKYSKTTTIIQNMVKREVPGSMLEMRALGW